MGGPWGAPPLRLTGAAAGRLLAREPAVEAEGLAGRIIVAGAGPVGAVLTLALCRRGVPVTLVEREPAPAVDQRAASIQPSVVGMLDELGIAGEVIAKGSIARHFHYRDRTTGALVAAFDHDLLKDDTPFPFVVQYEQFKLVETVIENIGAADGVEYRFGWAVSGFAERGGGIEVEICGADGAADRLRGSYLVGCDGGASFVRKAAGIAFPGFTWPERFVKIATTFDFFAAGRGYCQRNFLSDPEEWANLFHVPGDGPPGIWRMVFPTRVGETDEECLSAAGVQARLQKFFPKDGDYPVAYTGLYFVHQRVAETFNKGRVLLAGDAAHVNNPIGGLGMNGGIHDAVNLADKLARIVCDGAPRSLLDRYTRQRRKAQMDGVQAATIANKKLMEARDPARRKAQLDDIRRTAEDPARARAYLRRSSLIESLEAAEAVA